MEPLQDEPITALMRRLADGEAGASEELAAAVVDSLERIARREMVRRGGLEGLTLEPRIFAHDALLKILDSSLDFESRRQLFAYSAKVIGRAVIDYHRTRRAQKRRGGHRHVTLSRVVDLGDVDLESFPPILDELEALDSRSAEVVRLRVYFGATMDHIAEILGLSISSVERDWRFARSWLAARLRPDSRPSDSPKAGE